MLIDLTIQITKQHLGNALANEKMASFGHLGTHFDVMNKEFPLEFTRLPGIIFDVSEFRDADIILSDVALAEIRPHDVVLFHTGFIEQQAYGTKEYFTCHPQLDNGLIDQLLTRRVSLIGIDCAGVRRGAEHTPKDQYCADKGVFIIENLCNLGKLLQGKPMARAIINTYPIKFADMTGLPCRVIAEMS